jgi:hypothetical protein
MYALAISSFRYTGILLGQKTSMEIKIKEI